MPEFTHAIASTTLASRLWRGFYLVLAVVSLCLAVLGLLLPGLPCTEFVLLAAWAAAKSSPRLHTWLVNHPRFGPMLHNWRNGCMLSRRNKWVATASMSWGASLIAWQLQPLLALGLISCMALVLIWLWHRIEPPPA
ncbi:YbaN family protein [Chitinimonas sp. BJB300]|uniref:YbaN family protein n=1 Tax=Chitinimonas sp. BJB300 TaxID=1559339 RepID=UPI000C11D420|nr:YbaN family protein [Chitinimonas sp. BJB300]PHV10009.1 hypothetical protein CSQ89_18495 [Chitinimonas sp. BJB300]TSJ87701.1 DUF454 domain-containing protein [Chitinimonas sp. BJB300]